MFHAVIPLRIKASLKPVEILQSTVERLQVKFKNQQILLSLGDEIYLYGDTTDMGTLVHPVERTSPPMCTVKLDRGGHEAVNIRRISAIKL